MAVYKLVKSKKEDGSKQKIVRIINVLLGVTGILLLLITQNFKYTMVFIDHWSVFFLIIIAAQILLHFILKAKTKSGRDINRTRYH